MRTPSPIADPDSSDDEVLIVPVTSSREDNLASLLQMKTKFRDVISIYENDVAAFDEQFGGLFVKQRDRFGLFKAEVARFRDDSYTDQYLDSISAVDTLKVVLSNCQRQLLVNKNVANQPKTSPVEIKANHSPPSAQTPTETPVQSIQQQPTTSFNQQPALPQQQLFVPVQSIEQQPNASNQLMLAQRPMSYGTQQPMMFMPNGFSGYLPQATQSVGVLNNQFMQQFGFNQTQYSALPSPPVIQHFGPMSINNQFMQSPYFPQQAGAPLTQFTQQSPFAPQQFGATPSASAQLQSYIQSPLSRPDLIPNMLDQPMPSQPQLPQQVSPVIQVQQNTRQQNNSRSETAPTIYPKPSRWSGRGRRLDNFPMAQDFYRLDPPSSVGYQPSPNYQQNSSARSNHSFSSRGNENNRRAVENRQNNDRGRSQHKKVRFDESADRPRQAETTQTRIYGATQPLVPGSRKVDRAGRRDNSPEAHSLSEYRQMKMRKERAEREAAKKQAQDRHSNQASRSSSSNPRNNNNSNPRNNNNSNPRNNNNSNHRNNSSNNPPKKNSSVRSPQVKPRHAPDQVEPSANAQVSTSSDQPEVDLPSFVDIPENPEIPTSSKSAEPKPSTSAPKKTDAGSSNVSESQQPGTSAPEKRPALNKPLFTAKRIKIEEPDQETEDKTEETAPPPEVPHFTAEMIKIEANVEEQVDLFEVKQEPIETSDYQIVEPSHTQPTETVNDNGENFSHSSVSNIFQDPKLLELIGDFNEEARSDFNEELRQDEASQRERAEFVEPLENAIRNLGQTVDDSIEILGRAPPPGSPNRDGFDESYFQPYGSQEEIIDYFPTDSPPPPDTA